MVWVACCCVNPSGDRTQVQAETAPGRTRGAASREGSSVRRQTRGGRGRNIGIGRVSTEDSACSEASRPPLDAAAASDVSAGRVAASATATAEEPASAEHSSRASARDAPDDGLLPFRRQKTRDPSALRSRRSIDCMEGYLVEASPAEAAPVAEVEVAAPPVPPVAAGPPGSVVTKDSIRVSCSVVRGPDWKWGEEDGGHGSVGQVTAFNSKAQTATVSWQATGRTHDHYRCGRCNDLAFPPSGAGESGGLRRMCTAKDLFADPGQTCIIFDWDDTLFPTTYVRDDLALDWRTPMRSQPLAHREKMDIMRLLGRCSDNACAALRGAARLGQVVLVTLARSPWVKDSCANFFPKVGSLIEELQIQVVYAQDGKQIEYDKAKMTSSDDIEQFWSQVKSKAIAAELRRFYSRYEGQSWKNIISIGDSDFERLGTQQAAQEYLKLAGIENSGGLMRQKTVEVGGRVYKVRTKTFKMLDQPTVEELTVELAMLERWLSPLVKLDGSCDINLNDIEDPKTLQRIERTLHERPQ